LFDPLAFLDVAHSLASDGEAEMRTCVGRAYYGLFLRARDGLEAAGLMRPLGDGRDHGAVIVTLRRNKRGTAGNKLDKLRELRAKADYSTSTPVGQRDVSQALQLADDIKTSLAPDWQITP